jgi:hypothetical protein
MSFSQGYIPFLLRQVYAGKKKKKETRKVRCAGKTFASSNFYLMSSVIDGKSIQQQNF